MTIMSEPAETIWGCWGAILLMVSDRQHCSPLSGHLINRWGGGASHPTEDSGAQLSSLVFTNKHKSACCRDKRGEGHPFRPL